ncbi:MAG: hypothetical protein WCE46_09355 [Methanoregula sp.]|jgi:hypothetical protein|uniref:DUF7289 family protein n=1 Tax=Methanoregula sp. TaxID=2052170 RepID=UPI003C73E58F
MQTGRKVLNGNDRAVSEAIGFIIIFGIIIAGIGLVTLYGYPMLLQQQSSSNEQIMEKNMIVLQNDLKSVAYKTVPYKETSLNVGGGALTVYNTTYDTTSTTPDSSFSLYDNYGNVATSGTPLKFYPGDLRYESTSAETGISLENGAVVKRMFAEDGSTMLAEPRWFHDSQTNTFVIYLIGFNTTTDVMAQTGVGTVKMKLNQTNYIQDYIPYNPVLGPDIIHVTYTQNNNANYSTAWGNYLTGTLNMQQGGNPGEYLWSTGTQPANLVIYEYEIIIESV